MGELVECMSATCAKSAKIKFLAYPLFIIVVVVVLTTVAFRYWLARV